MLALDSQWKLVLSIDAPPQIILLDEHFLDTVVTCFPRRWDSQRPGDTTTDKTDVLQNIIDLLNGNQGQKIRTAWSLAEFIVDYCTRNVFDSENMPDEEHQFLEFFSHSISNVVSMDIIS
jgi:hypothetical protein